MSDSEKLGPEPKRVSAKTASIMIHKTIVETVGNIASLYEGRDGAVMMSAFDPVDGRVTTRLQAPYVSKEFMKFFILGVLQSIASTSAKAGTGLTIKLTDESGKEIPLGFGEVIDDNV